MLTSASYLYNAERQTEMQHAPVLTLLVMTRQEIQSVNERPYYTLKLPFLIFNITRYALFDLFIVIYY